MRTKLFFSVTFLLLFIKSGFSQLQARLDSNFLSVGEFWDGYLNQYNSIIASTVLPDSTVVYVAQVTAGSGSSVLIKLKYDGTIDSSFGSFGKFSYTINGAAPTVKGIHLFNNKLYLSGKVGRDKFVSRININGTIDNTFGLSGTRTLSFGTPIVDITNSFAMDTSGNSYVGCRFTSLATSTTELTVTKINSSGNIVTGFGSGGRASFTLPTGAVSTFTGLAIDANQKIIATGCGNNTTNNVVLVVKFNQNGTLDNSFDSNGYKLWTFPGADVYQVASNHILSTGNNLIIAGEYLQTGVSKSYVFKIKPNGSYDSTFANNGLLMYTNGTHQINFHEMKVAKDGGIMIAGSAGNTANSYISLLRLLSNGTIDSSFAPNGMFLNQVGTRWEGNVAHTLSIYKDDKVFLGGNSSDCDAGVCYFTSSMSRVTYGEIVVINDTTSNDTTSTTSLKSLENLVSIHLYPNPLQAGNELSVSSSATIEGVKIVSLSGQEIPIEFNNKRIKLPSHLSKGVYFVRFETNKTLVTKKIIVN